MKFLKISNKQKLFLELCIGLGLGAYNAWSDWSNDHRLLGTYVFIGIICLLAYTYYDVYHNKK